MGAFKSFLCDSMRRLTPKIGNNLSSRSDLIRFRSLLFERSGNPAVLILGGGIITIGTDVLLDPSITLVESDVYIGPRTRVVIDAHDIPFQPGTFDGVVMQAMLEHVADPYRVVSEVFRVLKDGGFVYASVPFMQQVHLGAYDFTRFTELGLRRLFRRFEEVDRGAFAGSGTALAWSLKYYLLNCSEKALTRRFLELLGACLSFWLKYTDFYLKKKQGVYDSASGYYFLGKKSTRVVSDRELINLYRGAL